MIAWDHNSRAVFVQRGTQLPATIERIDLASGSRSVRLQLPQSTDAGVSSVSFADWVDEGPWYAYTLSTLSASLFTVTGVR